jgi:NADH-quinone oxidoreductase subunit F
MITNTTTDLAAIRKDYLARLNKVKQRVVICAGTGCMANGAMDVYDALVAELETRQLDVAVELREEKEHDIYVSKSGCQGFCQMGPLVTIEPQGLLYVKVRPADVAELVQTTFIDGGIVERLVYKNPADGQTYPTHHEVPFYKRQNRFVLGECGILHPEDINEYISRGGYEAARKAFCEMTPEAVCQEMIASGLRGRGGGGFPTGRKWELTRVQPEPKKYVICNGDEGDPGAFMDRSLMEGNPHRVIEGMMIAARASGPTKAMSTCGPNTRWRSNVSARPSTTPTEAGLLGDDLFGTGLAFRLHVMEGAGAFVCGEETALMASIEGSRGMPRPKPPFPAQSGLWGKPTVINNVETLATVPLIIAQGSTVTADGHRGSPGTKTFALTGHVSNTGLIEVPFGTTLREIIFEIGGGVTTDKGKVDPDGFKAVQIGGPVRRLSDRKGPGPAAGF